MKQLLIALALMSSGCHISVKNNDDIDGNGILKKETRSISDFKGVDVEGPFNVVLVQGNTFSVEIETDENLLQYIDLKNDNGKIVISEKDGYELNSKKGIIVRIQMPTVNQVNVSGSGSVKSETILSNIDAMEINIGGSGNITLELKSPKIDVGIGGSGKATLSGTTRNLDISIGGSGDCLAEELLSEECVVTIGGSGTARVYASTSLKGTIGGSGDIFYRGEPKDIKKSISGSGSIDPIK